MLGANRRGLEDARQRRWDPSRGLALTIPIGDAVTITFPHHSLYSTPLPVPTAIRIGSSIPLCICLSSRVPIYAGLPVATARPGLPPVVPVGIPSPCPRPQCRGLSLPVRGPGATLALARGSLVAKAAVCGAGAWCGPCAQGGGGA